MQLIGKELWKRSECCVIARQLLASQQRNSESTTSLNPDVLLCGLGSASAGAVFGKDIAEDTESCYAIRLFAGNGSRIGDILFSQPSSSAHPTAHSSFKDNVIIRSEMGRVGIGTVTPNAMLDVNGNSIVETSNTPADNAPCTANTIWWDTNYFHLCVMSGTVKRDAFSTY
jgi:hypothetical protein